MVYGAGVANLTCAQIVLAGGRSRRLDGVTKALLLYRGETLLQHALAAVPAACHRVVVGPPELPVAAVASLVREDPPFGGPVAGINAGAAELARLGCSAEWVLITACDHPYAESAAATLLSTPPPADVDLIAPTDATGHRQTLFALYRRSALTAALGRLDGGQNCSVRRLVEPLRSHSPVLPDGILADIDDAAAAARAGITVPPT